MTTSPRKSALKIRGISTKKSMNQKLLERVQVTVPFLKFKLAKMNVFGPKLLNFSDFIKIKKL